MSKGKRREREAASLWQRAGYKTYSPQESKWGETDMYGLFDVVAFKRTEPVTWIQVKSNRAAGIEEWSHSARTFLGPHNRAYMAVCVDREGWRVLRPTTDGRGYTTVCDGREHDGGMGEAVVEWLVGGDGDG